MAVPYGFDQDIGGRLQLAFARLSRLVREQDPSGLPYTDASMFVTIATHDEPTLGELAVVEGVAPPTVTRVVAALEAEGLVQRFDDPHDRRVRRVRLTRRGRAQYRTWNARYVERFNALLDQLSAAERRRLIAAIDALEHLAGLQGVAGEAESLESATPIR